MVREPRLGGSPTPRCVSGKPFATGRVDLPRVTAAVRHMVGSVEPSRMFSELARVCVPAISDACTIDLVEEGGHRYRLRQPTENPYGGRGSDQHELVAEADFASDGAGGPRFSGVLTCCWFDGYRPGEADAALLGLLVDHTTALVEHERLTARVDELQTAPGERRPDVAQSSTGRRRGRDPDGVASPDRSPGHGPAHPSQSTYAPEHPRGGGHRAADRCDAGPSAPGRYPCVGDRPFRPDLALPNPYHGQLPVDPSGLVAFSPSARNPWSLPYGDPWAPDDRGLDRARRRPRAAVAQVISLPGGASHGESTGPFERCSVLLVKVTAVRVRYGHLAGSWRRAAPERRVGLIGELELLALQLPAVSPTTRTAPTSSRCGRPSWHWSPRSASGWPTRTELTVRGQLAAVDSCGWRPAGITRSRSRAASWTRMGTTSRVGWVSKCRYVSHTTRATRSVSRSVN